MFRQVPGLTLFQNKDPVLSFLYTDPTKTPDSVLLLFQEVLLIV